MTWNKDKQDESLMPRSTDLPKIVGQQYDRALYQIGTLGSGNHFLEIQVSLSDNRIWIMIHSGSRNLGKQVADEYNKIAVALNKKWHTSVNPKWELAFLPLDTPEAKAYVEEMQYCVDFALANRKLMMERVLQAFEHEMKTKEVADGNMINIAHNYARMESHFGKNVLVHRKGATSARKGEVGIIPGSQGTKSYIVMGLGNEESFQSCSHGAGRKMGRKDAQRRLDLEIEKKKLDEQGIIHGIKSVEDLDEAAGAYKDIDVVMENQNDLVSILHELSPLAVVKG
jgi:tRNA-splicing ligase RtcB